MTCASGVERAFKDVPGVTGAAMQFAANRARVGPPADDERRDPDRGCARRQPRRGTHRPQSSRRPRRRGIGSVWGNRWTSGHAIIGLLFGLGLAVAGLSGPVKVLSFRDLATVPAGG